MSFGPNASYPNAGLPYASTAAPRRVTVRFGSHSFATLADDEPGSTPIQGRLAPMRFTAELGTDRIGRYAGAAPLGYGDVVLANPDGALDSLARDTYSDGAVVRLRVGKRDRDRFGRPEMWPLRDFGTVLTATAEQWIAEDSSPRLRLRDAISKLAVPVQPFLFSGSGDLGGPVELAGTTKPICYGLCRNVAPVLIDGLLWIYQFNDQRSEGVDAVRDRGVRLTMLGDVASGAELQAAAIAPGGVLTCLALGLFRLGSPPVGQVTADVRGAAQGSRRSFWTDGSGWVGGGGWAGIAVAQYAETTASVISRLMTDRSLVRPEQIETTSFSGVERDAPGRIGIYLPAGDRGTLLDVASRLAEGVGACLGQGSDGRYELRQFRGPPAAAMRELTDRHITEIRTRSLPWRTPPSRWLVRHGICWTRQSQDELAEAALPADRAAVQDRDASHAAADNPDVRAVLPSAGTAQVDSFFNDAGDALAEAQRLAALYGLGRSLHEVRTTLLGLRYWPGDTVTIRYPSPFFAAGRPTVVVGRTVDTEARQCALRVMA